MPYSKSPTISTYSVERVSLLKEINTRPGTTVVKDEDYLNCFVDVIRNRKTNDSRDQVVKRAGSALLSASVASSTIRGMYYWNDFNTIYYAVGANVYVYDVNSGSTTTLSSVFSTTSGEVGFCEYLYIDPSTTSNPSVLVVTDGTTASTITPTGTVVVLSAAPTPHLPNPIFLDGYLFLVDETTRQIYNSDVNDPLTWDSGSVIVPDIEGDKTLKIAKTNNYFIAFGSKTIEFFWDSESTTGSPLQKNDTFSKNIGYVGGFAQVGNTIYFIGNSTNSEPAIYKLEDLKVSKVSTPAIERFLIQSSVTYASVKAALVSIQGKDFYVLNADSYTYVLDIDSNMWLRWAYKINSKFDITNCVNTYKTSTYQSVFSLGNNTSELYYFSDSLGDDSGTAFTMKFITDSSDFGTMRRKTMSRLSIICDRPADSTFVSLSWSDDDYKSYNTPRTIELDQDLPSLNRMGSFRQRIFKFEYTGSSLIRLQEFEVEINKGIT
jgi:hypothetical protein